MVTYQQQSAALSSVGGEESRTEQVELVGLAQELLGLKRFSLVGQGGACGPKNCCGQHGSRMIFNTASIQVASMLNVLGPHVTRQSYFQFSFVGSLP